LRDENRYYNSLGEEREHWSKKRLVEVFSPGEEEWQEQVLSRGKELYLKIAQLVE
jgi:hypothetical protein